MNRRILLLCCYCGFGVVTLLSAQQPEIQFDVTSFRGRSGLVSLDIYIQFDRAHLEYEANKDGWSTKLAAVVLLKQQGQIITFDQLDILDQLPKSADRSSGSFTRFITFDLSPGNYDLDLAVTDGRGGEFDSTMQLQLAEYAAQETGISSLVLASAVHPQKSDKQLRRRGFNIYPMADDKVSGSDGLLWYYGELYGLTPDDTVLVNTMITDSTGTTHANNELSVVAAELIYPHWGAINPAGLKAGHYDLSVTGQIGDDTVSAVHAFTILVSDSTVTEPDSIDQSWDKITRRKLERIVHLMGGTIDHVRFIALDSLAQMNLLDEQAKALNWEMRDSSAEAWSNWIERWQWIRNTDPGYRYSGRLTPAGEVLLNYGLPMSINRHGSTTAHWGYQTWRYGDVADSNFVVFLELDRKGITLLSGNLPGVIWRDDWQTAVARGTDLAAYFSPVEAAIDSSEVEDFEEVDIPIETVATEIDSSAESELAPIQPSEETVIPDSTETTVPETEPTIQLDESGIQAPAGATDSTAIDTTMDIE
ncbi:hypothetical protein ACFL6E_04500 [Candidatus Neomarinimicrobiota bacterium]